MSKEFTQLLYLTEAKREANVIKNVHISGLKSENGYNYLTATLKEAASMYEGVDVYLNHYSDGVQNKFGWLQNVRHDDTTGLWGDLVANEKHENFESIMWWAENKPAKIGLSQVVQAEVLRDTSDVIKILRVRRVDLVADPATTKGLFEEKHVDTLKPPAKDKTMDLKDLTIEQLTEQRSDLVKQIKDGAATVEREFQECLQKVPETARTDTFKTVLRNAETKELRESIIADLTKLTAAPVSHKPEAPTPTKTNVAAVEKTQDELAKLY